MRLINPLSVLDLGPISSIVYTKPCVLSHTKGEFVYAVTAAEGIILSSLFIGRKQR